jgi:hypothetical protein
MSDQRNVRDALPWILGGDQQPASPAALPVSEEPLDAVGLSLDMIDADRLRLWANRLEEYGPNITEWGSVEFVVQNMRQIANGIETAVRDIGTLRQRTGGVSPCGHYRVFSMPCVQEDGSEVPYCMQCDRDELQRKIAEHVKSGSEEPRREEPDKLLRIAGLVNGYHNDGTKLSAAETLAAIADVLGDPFDFSSSSVVVGADQQEKELVGLLKAADALLQRCLTSTLAVDDWREWRIQVAAANVRALISPALPDPGSPEREK